MSPVAIICYNLCEGASGWFVHVHLAVARWFGSGNFYGVRRWFACYDVGDDGCVLAD